MPAMADSRSDWNERVLEPSSWRDRARGVGYVAEVLRVEFLRIRENRAHAEDQDVQDCKEVALMSSLAYYLGMTLELAAKAEIAAHDEKPPFTHKLVDLCEQAGVALSPEETELVDKVGLRARLVGPIFGAQEARWCQGSEIH